MLIKYVNLHSCDGWLSNFTEHSPPWEANSHSASQEIPRLLRNPKVHYHVHKGQLMVPIHSQVNTLHTFSPYIPKIQFNSTFPSMPRSYEWSLRILRLQFCMHFYLSHACYVSRPSHDPRFDHPNNIYGEMYKLRCSSLCSLLESPATLLTQLWWRCLLFNFHL
jgi:hypothetical protein